MPAQSPKVFISYARDDDEYCLWVKRFATRLRADGVNVRLDAWDLGDTGKIPAFMNREIRHAERVLVLCSPAYRSKVHATEDGEQPTGAGWEAGLLNSQTFVLNKNKVVAALARGSWPEAAPDFLLSDQYDDLSNPHTFEASYRKLLRRLTGTSEKPPPLGELPADLKPEPVEPLRYPKTGVLTVESLDGIAHSRRLLRGPKKWKKATWAAGVAAVAALTWIGRLYLGAPSAGATLDGPLGIRFRYVPSGTYRIGEQDDSDATSHSARLTRGIWLAETELTQAQWSRLVSRQPSTFVGCGGDCPVETVSWYEAVAFANRLSDRFGLARCYKLESCDGTLDRGKYTCESVTFAGLDCPGYRLPTAAEWEVAARAGTTTAIYTGPLIPLNIYNAPELDPIAWYFGNSGVSYAGAFDCSKFGKKRQYAAQHCGPHPVGQKQANAWGFRDMLGNVEEWGGDGWGDYPSGMLVDPFIPPPKDRGARVFRGGSWRSHARSVRPAEREFAGATFLSDDLGFRLARSEDLHSSVGGPGL